MAATAAKQRSETMEKNGSSNMKEGLPGLEQRSTAAHGEDDGKETCSAAVHGGPQWATAAPGSLKESGTPGEPHTGTSGEPHTGTGR